MAERCAMRACVRVGALVRVVQSTSLSSNDERHDYKFLYDIVFSVQCGVVLLIGIARYLIKESTTPEGAAVPELVRLRLERDAGLAEEKKKALWALSLARS
eukprot:497356-Amphidinium_carterae.1